MKFTPLAASLFALALFAAPVLAEDPPVVQEQPAVEQPAAEAPTPEAPAAQVPQEILDFLADNRPVGDMSVEDLAARAKQARRFSKVDGLPQEVQTQLQNVAQAARGEIAAREEQAAQKKPVEEPPAAEKPAEAPAKKVEPAPAETAAPAQAEVPPEVAALLGDTRAASELSGEELNARAKQARKFAKMDGLPRETRDQLQALADGARAEFLSRKAAEEEKKKAEQPPAVEKPPVAEQPPAAEQPVEPPPAKAAETPVEPPAAPPAATADVPPEVITLLADVRQVTEMTPEELAARFKSARQFSKADGLSEETKGQLTEIAKAARAEIMAREQQAGQKTDAPAVPAAPADAAAPVDPAAPVAPAAPVVDAAVPPPPPAVIEVAPTAPLPPPPAPVAETPAPPPAPAVAPVTLDKAQAQKLDGNTGSPEAEAKAKAFLDDPTSAEKLNDADLRTRLDGIRELMAGNELSRDTERALRQKLKTERDILRNRVALAETAPPPPAAAAPAPQPGAAAPPPPPPPSTARPSRKPKVDVNISIEFFLNDRRPSDELDDYELRRRLEVYRQATYDQRYEAQQRAYWRAVMDRDQYLLQQRLLRERREREAELQAQYEAGQYEYTLNDDEYDPRDDERDDVYAAEIDDSELQDVLIAPPRKKITRKYTVKEVEASPDLRAALPRVEIDTVRFGFNEAFVRAEEVSNLDKIGAAMERILKSHPREVFLIEGHTDAVGSDAANIALSRQRAEAIKKALLTYFVIPAKNLKTVGYGERYLKIPTAEAEQENRRVSVSRATALIGQAEE
jgi:outer membrane protein OmpA-like peptidoglycan-associated protein